MNKHAPDLKSHFSFPTFQLAQGAQRPHAMATAPATRGTRGQASATAAAASTGPRVSSARRADTASPAGVRSSSLSISVPTSSPNCSASSKFLSEPSNTSLSIPEDATWSQKEGGEEGVRRLHSCVCTRPPTLTQHISSRMEAGPPATSGFSYSTAFSSIPMKLKRAF